MKHSDILITEPGPSYELIDSGDGEKLERFGPYVLSRPDPQALWHKKMSPADWKRAVGSYKRKSIGDRDADEAGESLSDGSGDGQRGDWSVTKEVPQRWSVDFGGLKLWIKPSSFKHVGLFPEQSVNWEWVREKINTRQSSPKKVEILNLFGYTGAATLAAAQAGANVVHVDGSKVAVTWARENAELSGLSAKPIRWIVDDARAFVRREIKRGRKYDAIIMDPPAFGHGPENELWKIEEHFLALVDSCLELLSDEPLFFLINGYSAGYSAIAYENDLLPLQEKFGGTIETGELAIRENSSGQSKIGRLLPAGIFARWSK